MPQKKKNPSKGRSVVARRGRDTSNPGHGGSARAPHPRRRARRGNDGGRGAYATVLV